MMISILSFINKVFVSRFYKMNAGFFIFFFFIFFGAVQPGSLIGYHYSLIQAILSSPIIAISVCLLWLLYNNKAIGFVKRTIKSEDGNYLHIIGTLPARAQGIICLVIQLYLYAPILVYGMVVLMVAWFDKHYLAIPFFIVFHLGVCLSSAWIYHATFNFKSYRFFAFYKPMRRRIESVWFYFLHYFIHLRKLSVLVIKGCSYIILNILVLNNLPLISSDFILPFVMLILTHMVLCYWLVRFAEGNLSFIRNLPLSIFKIIFLYLFTYSVLFLPELLFLLNHISEKTSGFDVLIFYSILVMTMLLFTSVQYNDQMNMNEYVKVVFLVSFVLIFFLLAKAYLYLLAAEVGIGILLFVAGYYKYESAQSEN